MMPIKFGFVPMGFFKESCSWAFFGLWIVWIEIVSIVHCFMQASSAARHCRSTLSRKKKAFYFTNIYIYISILVYRLCAIITYIICCLPTPKCPAYPIILSSSSVSLGTHQFQKPRKSCRADQQSCVCYKLAKLYRNRTQKSKRESGKENESTNVLVALKPSEWERRFMMMSHF
jgi:hypothetical protein